MLMRHVPVVLGVRLRNFRRTLFFEITELTPVHLSAISEQWSVRLSYLVLLKRVNFSPKRSKIEGHKSSFLSRNPHITREPVERRETMSEKPVTTLVLVDVQKDFHPGGSLAIPTADADAERIATLLRSHPEKITRVVATMDSHQKLHIAHPGFWVSGEDGTSRPGPFTIISSQEIVDGKWKPRSGLKIPANTIDASIFPDYNQVLDSDGSIDLLKYSIQYTKKLEEKGKFKLCIWPEHCLIGSVGHTMVDVVFAAVQEWSQTTGGSVEWVLKGENLLTESYSALEAEVPIDKTTSFASNLQTSLEESDHLLLCGQAMSHCVNYTARSIIERWPKDKLSNITLLTDCASSVPGFEEAGDLFQTEVKALGVQLKSSSEVFS